VDDDEAAEAAAVQCRPEVDGPFAPAGRRQQERRGQQEAEHARGAGDDQCTPDAGEFDAGR
jgi:hypothetical protein